MFIYLKSAIILMIMAWVFILPSGLNANELFFSEYIEGTSFNKALEIYNPNADFVDLGLDDYCIGFYNNGSSAASSILKLTGILSPDDTYTIVNTKADQAIKGVADILFSSLNFNGNDAIILFKGDSIIDSIGRPGEDPGDEWGVGLFSTLDNTLRRRPEITTGDLNPYDVFDPLIEWEGFSVNTFDGLGSHQLSVPVPEPATMLLLGAGFIALAGFGKKRAAKK
jgi:predicted extracellular nuclease